MPHVYDLTSAMARNVELKARILSLEALLPKAAALATEGPFHIQQDDTFFHCERGRLKLRDFLDGSGELIFYRRPDQAGPKESFYVRSTTSTPAALRDSLELAYGQAGRVIKRRTVYLIGRTRLHLDQVQELGEFLELEVVLTDGESTEAGTNEAREIMDRLGIQRDQLIGAAYVDLLAEPGE